MTLFQVGLTLGTLLIALGIMLLRADSRLRVAILSFPRSKSCSVWFVMIGTGWFLWRHVANLSEADFGNYKLLISAISLSVAGLSFFYVADFLAVRGLCMLVLLFSREALDAAFLEESSSRLVLVTVTYLLIVLSLYFGAWPYRMRDFIEWMNRKKGRVEGLAVCMILSGIPVLIVALAL